MQSWSTEDIAAAMIVVAAVVALAMLMKRRSPWRPNLPIRPFSIVESELAPRTFGSTLPDHRMVSAQMSAVMAGTFQKRRVLNRSEQRVFCVLEETVEPHRGHRLFAQASLGEVLQSPDKNAFFAINAKRVDFLIVDSGGWPALAIEYQGEGHYQGDAAARDAIKKEALRKAGVRYLEIVPGDSDAYIKARVSEFMGWSEPQASSVPQVMSAAHGG